MHNQYTLLRMNIYCIKDLAVLFDWAFLLRIISPNKFCDVANYNVEVFPFHVLVILSRSFRIIYKHHGLFVGA